MGKAGITISQELEKTTRKLFEEGKRDCEIVKQTGISKGMVWFYRRLWKYPVVKKCSDYEYLIEPIKQDIQNDLTLQEIRDKYKLTPAIERGFVFVFRFNLKIVIKEHRKKKIVETLYKPGVTAKEVLDAITIVGNEEVKQFFKKPEQIYYVARKTGHNKIGGKKHTKNQIYISNEVLDYLKKETALGLLSFSQMAQELNQLGHRTYHGKEWTTNNLYMQYERIFNNKEVTTVPLNNIKSVFVQRSTEVSPVKFLLQKALEERVIMAMDNNKKAQTVLDLFNISADQLFDILEKYRVLKKYRTKLTQVTQRKVEKYSFPFNGNQYTQKA